MGAGGYTAGVSHDYNPEWDYTIDKRPDPAVVAAVARAQAELGLAASSLGLGEARIYYVKGLDRGHLARYVNGTDAEPVFVLDSRQLVRAAAKYELDMDTALVPTLKHELAHAYLESAGVESEEAEEVVERFASICWDQGDEIGVEWLKGWVEQESLRVG